jgi:hypothetical protein
MSTKHGQFRRPEITRENDLLAQDQRRIIDVQKRRLENEEKRGRMELMGLINSKVFSNLQFNVDTCLKQCKLNNFNKEESSRPKLDSPFMRLNKKEEHSTDGVDMKCFDFCVKKRTESYKMLVLFFFEKMKRDHEKRDDFETLYEMPEKFKKANL